MVDLVNPGMFSALHTAVAQLKAEHPGSYDTPMWGERDAPQTKDLGYVVGYQDTARRQSYRAQIDRQNGLHLVWESDGMDASGRKTTVQERYLVAPPHQRPEDELHGWWRDTTLRHRSELPARIQARMGGKSVWHGAFWA